MSYTINWASEFSALAPYLTGQCGVIHLRHRGPHGAPSAFLSRLKSEFLASNPGSSVLVVDEDNWSARYLNDIVDRLAEKIGHDLQQEGITNIDSVGSNNNAFGNINIDATILQGGRSPNRLDKLALAGTLAALDEFLKTSRLMIVIADGSGQVLGKWWRDFWKPHLSTRIQNGLVLVKFCDISKSLAVDADEPAVDLDVILPSEIALSSMPSFVNDMAAIIVFEAGKIGKTLSHSDAEKLANTMVWGNRDSVGELFASWPGALMNAVRNA